ncbi:MAG: FHA domain-containing protein [Firmicutes bacterium]|nr:FHA domain-containing protein [Bacillota bacterium]
MSELRLKMVGGGQNLELIIDKPTFILGKNPAMADGVIPNAPAVSRKHCQIEEKPDGFYVEDLGSLNCTFVNDSYIVPHTPVPLHNGDKLRLADKEFMVSITVPAPEPVDEPEEEGMSETTVLGGGMQVMRQTKIYMVYSPAGGSGKTICALGLCDQLSNRGARVLYLNGESVPTFDFYLMDQKPIEPGFEVLFRSSGAGNSSYDSAAAGNPSISAGSLSRQDLLPFIGNEGFDYLRRIVPSPRSAGIEEKDMVQLAVSLKSCAYYDAIVVDLSSGYSEQTIDYLKAADKVLIICLQDEISTLKLERFMALTKDFTGKYLYVCNRYRPQNENYLGNLISLGEVKISEFVEESDLNELSFRDIRRDQRFQTTVRELEQHGTW